jgi:hypothetical protein
MRRSVRLHVAVWLLVIASGCTAKEPVKVSIEQSSGAIGSAYRTYNWRSAVAAGDPRWPTEPMRRDWFIRGTVDRLLAGKGYTRASHAPDFLVDYEFVERDKQTSSVQEYIDYYRAGGTKGLIDAYTVGYAEGSLVLGIFDASTQGLIWRASAETLADQKDSYARIVEALRRMLARWPSR